MTRSIISYLFTLLVAAPLVAAAGPGSMTGGVLHAQPEQSTQVVVDESKTHALIDYVLNAMERRMVTAVPGSFTADMAAAAFDQLEVIVDRAFFSTLDAIDILKATYEIGRDCPNVAGMENRATPDTIACCRDAGCTFRNRTVSIAGELCVLDVCDCGAGTAGDLVAGYDDRAFLECAEYGSDQPSGDSEDSLNEVVAPY